jgi:hypothetical protein
LRAANSNARPIEIRARDARKYIVQFTWRKRDPQGRRYQSHHGPFDRLDAERHAKAMGMVHGHAARIEVLDAARRRPRWFKVECTEPRLAVAIELLEGGGFTP